jgi:hypothetical protein
LESFVTSNGLWWSRCVGICSDVAKSMCANSSLQSQCGSKHEIHHLQIIGIPSSTICSASRSLWAIDSASSWNFESGEQTPFPPVTGFVASASGDLSLQCLTFLVKVVLRMALNYILDQIDIFSSFRHCGLKKQLSSTQMNLFIKFSFLVLRFCMDLPLNIGNPIKRRARTTPASWLLCNTGASQQAYNSQL